MMPKASGRKIEVRVADDCIVMEVECLKNILDVIFSEVLKLIRH